MDFIGENSYPDRNFWPTPKGWMERAAYHDRTIPSPRYAVTGRPVASMSFVRLEGKPGLYLPVVRYEELYHDKPEPDNTYCGTFYYYEPHSNYYLHLGNCLVAAGKYHALRSLEFQLFSAKIREFEAQNGTRFDEIDILSRFQLVPNFLSSLYLFKFAEKMSNTMSTPPLIIAEYPKLGSVAANLGSDGTKPLFAPPGTRHLDQLLLLFNVNRPVTIMTAESMEELRRWSTGINQLTDPTQPIFDLAHQSAYEVAFKSSELKDARKFLTTIAGSEADLNRLSYGVRIVRFADARGIVKEENPYVAKDLYTDSDFMDQTLCRLALQFGYDTVLLQREVGKDRIVTEVVDLRPRAVSYSSFRFAENVGFRWNATAPTIWTQDLGFVTAVAAS